MCDRYSLSVELSELTDYFQIASVRSAYQPRYNIAPTQSVAAIVNVEGERRLESFRWGLMPFWAKDAVNADSESVMEKRAYRRMFSKQRCIIPCNGFYMWRHEGKVSQPVRIVLKDQGVFGMAGLYDIWQTPSGNEIRTCTLMTTRSNRLIYDYAPAMPAILREEEMASWLDPARNKEPDYLQTLLKPYHPERMRAYPVTPRLSDLSLESEECFDEASLPAKYALLK
ncbi:SOS response-associated peptidase [Paenibacillus cremeus]|uniref:Abasic site processing protein n=1 Tax=Paenibacillus cremeus TaxID=2163881 RepID=A0A559K549_9BACL|nr:SOS response-associated peptidase [Paenibacillus cremeus]TVY07268.1 SOS response-associated peptidase [Paenibacillus cremeus]